MTREHLNSIGYTLTPTLRLKSIQEVSKLTHWCLSHFEGKSNSIYRKKDTWAWMLMPGELHGKLAWFYLLEIILKPSEENMLQKFLFLPLT
jgi:hypothetical protein